MAVAVLVTACGLVGAACEPRTDAQPTVASVDFAPRLLVTVDGEGAVSADAGPNDGAQLRHGDEPGWQLPQGSVVELRVDGQARRLVVSRLALTAAPDDEPTTWLDTGRLEPGERTVLALTQPGRYTFADPTAGSAGAGGLTLVVTPRDPG